MRVTEFRKALAGWACAAFMAGLLAGCGGSGGTTAALGGTTSSGGGTSSSGGGSSSGTGGGGSTTPAPVTGIATPKSVSVVTAN